MPLCNFFMINGPPCERIYFLSIGACLSKKIEDCILEIFQIRNIIIKFVDIGPKPFDRQDFYSPDSFLFSVAVSGSPFLTQ